jgi:hypothetical protein
MKPLEASTGGGTRRNQEEETHTLPCYRVVGTGLGTSPEENQKLLEDMEEGRHEGKGEKCQFAYVLKFDGKSNWKAFYAKFSRYAEVGEWTEGNAGTSCAYHGFVPPIGHNTR